MYLFIYARAHMSEGRQNGIPNNFLYFYKSEDNNASYLCTVLCFGSFYATNKCVYVPIKVTNLSMH